jgi:hypothetical protein
MAKRLVNLKIDEVSSVDRGAGEGVRIMLMKRDAAREAAIDAYLKREFSDAERKELEAKGHAMPGGGYPIETKEDLHDAIQAFGRAKDKAATKAHIKRQAARLGATDMLPDDWVSKAEAAALLVAAGDALKASVAAIGADASIVGKADAVAAEVDAFKKFLAEVIPSEVVDALAADIAKECSNMTEAEKKAADEAEVKRKEKEKAEREAEKKRAEETEKALAKALREIAILKMAEDHKKYMDDAEMTEEEREKFAAKSPGERDQHMKDNPIEKRLPAAIQKALADAAADREILKGLREKDEIATFAKRAVDLGLVESQGEILRKAYSSDAAIAAPARVELEKLIKGLTKLRDESSLMKELGSNKPAAGDGTAAGDLQAKADELRAGALTKGGKMTPEQAWTKAYTDPANATLKKRYDAEEIAKRNRAAA